VAKRLKEAFLRWPLVLLMDDLYPNGPWLAFLTPLEWPFMIVLKAGNLSAWQKGRSEIAPDGAGPTQNSNLGDREQRFWWVNDLEDTGSDSQAKATQNLVLH